MSSGHDSGPGLQSTLPPATLSQVSVQDPAFCMEFGKPGAEQVLFFKETGCIPEIPCYY